MKIKNNNNPTTVPHKTLENTVVIITALSAWCVNFGADSSSDSATSLKFIIDLN